MICAVYLLLVNIISFALMGADKRRACRGRWRISERTLFLWAAIGGSAGALIGMQTFRHKTRKPLFRFGMPALCIVQIVLLVAASIHLQG